MVRASSSDRALQAKVGIPVSSLASLGTTVDIQPALFPALICMRPFVPIAFLAFATVANAQLSISARTRADANRLIDAAVGDSTAYTRLAELTDKFGHRLSGSQPLEDAISWTLERMKSDGLANVRGEPAMVPHWVRGQESVTLTSPRVAPLHMLGLGMSVGTPPAG